MIMNYVINGRTYSMKAKQFKELMNKLKKQFKHKKVILGLGKEGTVIARNDEFDSYENLHDAVAKWKSQGYVVFFVNGNG